MAKDTPAIRPAFNAAAPDAAQKIASDVLKVEAFFNALFAEAPRLKSEMSVFVATPNDSGFLVRSRDDYRSTYNDIALLRDKKTGYVRDNRICIYLGPDNRYEQLGASVETVLAHELGHWLDGAAHRTLSGRQQQQRAECIADVFAALLQLRCNPADKQAVGRDMARVVKATQGKPNSIDYTVPALARLLATCDTLDLASKSVHGLCDIARDITAKTYLQRGRAPRA